jgi:hypothetical protein
MAPDIDRWITIITDQSPIDPEAIDETWKRIEQHPRAMAR